MRDKARAAAMVDAGIIRRDRACDGKQTLYSLNDARHAAKSVARSTGRFAHPYKCPFCSHYHVTKMKHGEGA